MISIKKIGFIPVDYYCGKEIDCVWLDVRLLQKD